MDEEAEGREFCCDDEMRRDRIGREGTSKKESKECEKTVGDKRQHRETETIQGREVERQREIERGSKPAREGNSAHQYET